jgi:ornithine carbamoyltransferase
MKHLRTLLDLTADEIHEILALSLELKAKYQQGNRPPLLQGRVLAMLFEKPSLRTRNSFEAAVMHLGGGGIFLSTQEAGLNGRESLADIARVLSSYTDAIAIRTFSQQLIEEFATHSRCPVINALSDDRHPCQALTDLLTLLEVFGDLNGRKIVFIGDGNNIASSLAIAASILKIPMTFCTPANYAIGADVQSELQRRFPDAEVSHSCDPAEAVKDADVVYTDVWASMGQESEANARRKVFAPYQVNQVLMAKAPAGCRFMHDLPAHRGEEVTHEVIDGPNSIVFQQAENRMHLAKGLLVWLINSGRG